MPSLVKTLPRWYWTVWELMNSRTPISGLDRPSRASRAIWASWAVSSWLAATAGWAGRLRAVSPVASSSRRAGPFGEGLHADVRQQVMGGPELLPGVGAAVFAA